MSKANHTPPVASGTVAIDLDATIIPWGALNSITKPFPGAAEAIRHLKAEGYRIVILTSRLSRRWWLAEGRARDIDPWAFGAAQKQLVEDILRAADIPFDLVTAEKVPALAYFDDKGVRVDQSYTLETAIFDFLTGRYA